MEIRRSPVVPFWATRVFKPRPEEFIIRLHKTTLAPAIKFRLSRLQSPGTIGRKSGITYRNHKMLLLPHSRVLVPVHKTVSLRIREKVVGKESGVRVVTRWENVKPEYLQKQEFIPTIVGFVLVIPD